MKNFRTNTMKKIIQMSLGLSLAFSASFTILPTETHAASSVASFTGQDIINTGKKYLGVDYEFGGDSPSGFDCQGFTRYVFGKYGIRLDYGARNQSKQGTYVSPSNLRPGDLVFFSTKATMKYDRDSIKRIGHVGIYAGNGKVLHTYGEGGVKYNDITSGWWREHYVTARRVIKSGQATRPVTQPTLSYTAKQELILLQDLLDQYGYPTFSSESDLKNATTIKPENVRKGDIVLLSMDSNTSTIEHAAVYLGNGEVLHKTNTGSKTYSIHSSIVKDHAVTIKRAD